MSTIGNALTTWEEFLQLPDDLEGNRYELQDGEVVAVPPPELDHIFTQRELSEWLTANSQGCGHAYPEFPYRPAANLQFWFADVAHLPNEDWDALEGPGHPVYSPPLVAEVLSPSNTAKKIQRQRLAAFAGGTREFWVVDLRERTMEVSLPGLRSHIYHEHESVPVAVISGALLPVRAIFRH